MLRTKGLTDKLIVLGIDGMDPRFSKAMVDEGKMPNLKKLINMGAARTVIGRYAYHHPSNVGNTGNRLLSNDARYCGLCDSSSRGTGYAYGSIPVSIL